MAKKRLNYICNQLGIKLRTFDPHPLRKEVSEYIVNSEDCAIRSICKITNTEYKDVYKMEVIYMDNIHYISNEMIKALKEVFKNDVKINKISPTLFKVLIIL